MADRPDPILKAATGSTPGVPRSIRARIGATTDPVPEGKELDASPTRRFPLEPASHDVERTKPKAPEDLGVSEMQVAIKTNAKAEEGSQVATVAKELSHHNMAEEARWRDLRRQQGEMVQRDVRQAQTPPNRAIWQGTSTAANKQMDSRSGPRPTSK